jgi:hypothetical protein
LSVLGLLAICIALLVGLGERPRETIAPKEEHITVIDASCYSCGSGYGPSDEELASYIDLTPDEKVVEIDGVPMRGTALEAFGRRERARYHDEHFRLTIESPRGRRRVELVLH